MYKHEKQKGIKIHKKPLKCAKCYIHRVYTVPNVTVKLVSIGKMVQLNLVQ